MRDDIVQQVDAITREVAFRDHNGKAARVVVAIRNFATDQAKLWQTLTCAESIEGWFLPVSGHLRPGGRFQFEGNAGGDILLCEAPNRLEISWEFGGSVSWLNVTLSAHESGVVHLRLEHIARVGDDPLWDQFGPGAAGVGWDQALLGLAAYLETGTGMSPSKAQEWAVSEEGKGFLRLSSRSWGQAFTASGTDEEVARAAAERTANFYTGEGQG